MTIQQLGEVISTLDLEKICESIKRYGFRQASDEFKWEFDYQTILYDCEERQETVSESDFDDLQFHVSLCKNGKTYKDMTFIILTISRIERKFGNLPIPQKMFLFTDAPYNADYINDLNSIVQCSKCKKISVKKKLFLSGERLLCDKCYVKQLKKESRKSLFQSLSYVNKMKRK